MKSTFYQAAALDWTQLGHDAREAALDAHDGVLPSVEIAYTFFLDNPECFLRSTEEPEWPADMPSEAPIEFIAAYYKAI